MKQTPPLKSIRKIGVVGIHTGVGKTIVSAILTKALGAIYWKAVQCGHPKDEDRIRSLSPETICLPSLYSFKMAASPHLAAEKEGVRIESKKLTPPPSDRTLVIEGTGGFFSPLNEEETWADAAIHWDADWIVVHRHYLGSLNHFALTMEAIHQRGLRCLGVIFNGQSDLKTEEMLLKRGKLPCLGRLKWQKNPFTQDEIKRIAETWTPTLGF